MGKASLNLRHKKKLLNLGEGVSLTSKGEYSFPPKNRDRSCGACGGYGWVGFTLSEQRLAEQLESAHQEVFGSPYFDLNYLGAEFPSKRFCLKCCGLERRTSDDENFAQWRRDLRALKKLVSRVRKGETFELKGGREWWFAATTEFEHLANSPRPKKEKQRKKQSRSKPSLREELAELARLRETGALTELEFKVAKHKLLDAPGPTKRKRQATR